MHWPQGGITGTMMTPSEDPLEEHGGTHINNLNSILHIDEDTQDEEDYLEFNLSEYFTHC